MDSTTDTLNHYRIFLYVAGGIYAFLSMWGIIAMHNDKRAAETYQWRTSECKLQMIALAGGFPGIYMGAICFWHKIRKLGFNCILLLITLTHVAAWIFLYKEYFYKLNEDSHDGGGGLNATNVAAR